MALFVGLAAIALAVRLVVLDPDNIHMDESLYAGYGLHIAQTGDWFLINVGFPIDKIPVFFWAEAIVISWLGNTPLSIRLVDIASSLVTVGAVFFLARDLAGRMAGWFAGLALALSPFAILFGASVFVDPFSTALGLGALALARRDHAVAAGALAGLAIGGKLLALAYMPLALVLLLTIDMPRRRGSSAAFVVTFAITAGALLAFMAWRTQTYGVPWFLSAQAEGLGANGLVPAGELGPRFAAWWSWLGYFVESNPLRLIVGIGLVGCVGALVRHRGRLRWAIAALMAFAPAYLAILVVLQSPTYDRYLLYILPVLCVVAGIGIAEVMRLLRWQGLRRAVLVVATVFVCARSIPLIAQASSGAYPVGPRSDVTYAGYRQVCSWLQAHSSPSRVVWDHSFSWPLGYCLAGYPGYVYWFPDPSSVAPSGPEEYLALTLGDDPEGTVAALRARGLTVDLVETADIGGAPHLWIYHVMAAASTTP